MPSAKLRKPIDLPIPEAAMTVPTMDRFSPRGDAEVLRLSPRTLIDIAFAGQPEIKSSYHRFKSEEARFDFFYTSRDALTPRMRVTNSVGESREPVDDLPLIRSRDHTLELSLDKQFFDTTALNVSVGLVADEVASLSSSRPFVAASLRYPLWASREKLERTSEEIFWQNQVDDAQLSYIQGVRGRLEFTMFRFYSVAELGRRVKHKERWLEDIEGLLVRLNADLGGDRAADRARVEAEAATVSAEVRNAKGRYDVVMERLKAACGLPFHTRVELTDDPFNPFEGLEHYELFRVSIATDPEIATQRNAKRNAEVQLDLARRGRWDIALLVDGTSALEGSGQSEGASDWSVSFGLDVSAVDSRVTGALIRQAESNIARFEQAIAARENEVYVDTFEPLIRMKTLGESRDELAANLPRYQADYDKGVEAYFSGSLNVDDLLRRRKELVDQEEEISRLVFLVGANVAELCAATGKFFELLGD